MRVFLTVMDSVGIGAAPDASRYGDAGASTLAHLASAVGGLELPFLSRMGLGNIPALLPRYEPILGIPATVEAEAGWGALCPVSQGKDTTTGHWEIAGLRLAPGFSVFPPDAPSFPSALTDPLVERTGRGILGNCAASGTDIINTMGPAHMERGDWIVYTSADSVLQIAAHEARVPLDELYDACRIARSLANPFRIGRVIARPFTGTEGRFCRTENRRDFSMPLPSPCLLDILGAAGIRTVTVGKLDDIFPACHIDEAFHVETNHAALERLMALAASAPAPLFVFANLIDFDMLYGHRRDPQGYARALESADAALARVTAALRHDDILILTADHGNDPTFKGSDHTREWVPLILYRPGMRGHSVGPRIGLYDIAQSVVAAFGLPPMPHGTCFERGLQPCNQ